MKIYLGYIALFLSSTFITPAVAQSATTEFSLDNGLKVIVREDHRAPVVVSQLWYKVGSSYESPGSTGLAHALEHMMFKGSSKLGPGESSRILRELGAQENAFTSDDYTAYYQVLARDRLEVALEMEADRLASLTLPEDEFVREIEVIKEERRMRTDDRPSGLAYERFKALAYPASGYHIPTIGWMHDLDRMTIADLRDWHERWYAPNNATLVIVGDVQPAEVKTLVTRYFADIPARPIPAVKQPLELDEPGERSMTLYLKTQLPSVMMGFNVPSLTSSTNATEVHALRLISALLDGGSSSRIPTQLVRKQELVAGASAWYNAFSRGDSLFVLSATPNVQKGKNISDVETGLWQQLKQLQDHPPSAAELARVRAQVVAAEVYAQDSITSQATLIGQLETVGLSWRIQEDDLAALSAVTPADIQAAAKKFFSKTRLTTAYVYPEEARP
ncbi:MAG: insulinase family protein [Gammaproteobacteria bacterium]|nr:insulinase family protein [Gammaproteobacteria bacterium]